jgi:hypothetical protein
MRLVDSHGRNINYLRLSVTDRCNMRCFYCMPCEGIVKTVHESILSYEELVPERSRRATDRPAGETARLPEASGAASSFAAQRAGARASPGTTTAAWYWSRCHTCWRPFGQCW